MNDKVYNFKVSNSIYFKYDELICESKCTYDIQLEKKWSNNNYRIELTQSNYKLNGESIDKKFEKIIQEYNSSLFPILFDRKENSFLLGNFSEIVERIKNTDTQLRSRHEGPGLELIRSTFLNIIKDGNKMAEHLFSFSVIKVLFFCIQELGTNLNSKFQWDINTIDFTGWWKGKKVFDADSNSINFNGELYNTKEFTEKVKEYGLRYNIPFKIKDENLEVVSSLNHEIQYVTTGIDFETSETKIDIKLGDFFEYYESLSLSRK